MTNDSYKFCKALAEDLCTGDGEYYYSEGWFITQFTKFLDRNPHWFIMKTLTRKEFEEDKGA